MRDGWTETALGSVLKLSNKKLGPHKEEPEIFAISKYDGVVLAQDYFDRRIASKSLDGYKVIGPGDWVYSTIHIDEGSIAVNHFPFRGVVSPMYTSMIWNSHLHDYRFFEFLLKSDGALIRYQENAQGTVNRRRSLSWKAFSEMTFVVPPLAEQKRIVDMVSSVDAYIDALQQQAFSARTARNAVLHELISAGGDDWTETTIGSVCVVKGGKRLPKGTPWAVNPTAHPYIRATDFRDGRIDTSNLVYVPEEVWPVVSRYVVQAGDVLITIAGTIGAVALTPETHIGANLTENAALIRPIGKSLDSLFLHLWLFSDGAQRQISDLTIGTTQQKLGLFRIESIEIQLPPIDEQKRIVEIVSSMDVLIQSTEQAVMNANALRSGLLSELLSGEHEIPASYDSLLGAA